MIPNLGLYEKVRSVPPEAQKSIQGGRLKGMTDINPMWRIKTLTEQFGPVGLGWYYDILEEKIELGGNDEKVAFVKIALYIKYGEEWSKPVIGLGGSSFVAKERNGLYTSDECFKMALTDAIGIACKALGMGADVWWGNDRAKNNTPTNEPTTPSKQPTMDKTIVDNSMASDKQIGFIVKLAKEKNYTDKMAAHIKMKYNKGNSSELNKKEASEIIKMLNEL